MTATHPLWRPFALIGPEEIVAARVGTPANRLITVVAPDPGWPAAYEQVRSRLLEVLVDRALTITHVGSTSVPGLEAKPTIDIDLTVDDSSREVDYVPDLEAAGFTLRVREPGWEQHRLVTWPFPDANVHVWSPGAIEPRRHLAFASWLATHPADLAEYGGAKRDLAALGFADGMSYNNAKAALVYDLYERIFAADENHSHVPHPRPLA